MEEWVRDLISRATRGIKELAEAAWERFAWIHGFILSVLNGIKSAFGYFVNGAIHQLNKALSFAKEVYTTLRWVIITRIPQAVSAATTSITKWALGQIRAARDYAKGLYDTVIRWSVDRIREIGNTISNVRQWVSDRLTELYNLARKTGELVFTLLTSPQRMARWLVEAMVSELFRHIDRNADRIFTFVRQRSVYYTFRFADRLEDLISRLL